MMMPQLADWKSVKMGGHTPHKIVGEGWIDELGCPLPPHTLDNCDDANGGESPCLCCNELV
jgi:hypothetical protein